MIITNKEDYWRKTTGTSILLNCIGYFVTWEQILPLCIDIINYANWSPELVCCSMKCSYFWLRTRNRKDQKEKDNFAQCPYVWDHSYKRIFSPCFWLYIVVHISSSSMCSSRVYNWLTFVYRSVFFWFLALRIRSPLQLSYFSKTKKWSYMILISSGWLC